MNKRAGAIFSRPLFLGGAGFCFWLLLPFLLLGLAGGQGSAGVGGVAVGLVGDALCFLVAAAPAGVEDEGFADEEVGRVFAGTEDEECG